MHVTEVKFKDDILHGHIVKLDPKKIDKMSNFSVLNDSMISNLVKTYGK